MRPNKDNSDTIMIFLISAQVNVLSSKITTSSFVAIVTPIILRILLGPLPTLGVIFVYYLYRTAIMMMLSMLLIKICLRSAFIIRFEAMSGKLPKIRSGNLTESVIES